MLPERLHTPELTDHWIPMPEFDGERALLACYATFDGHDGLHELVDDYQRPLRAMPELAVVERAWLHSTVLGVAFVDELPVGGVEALAAVLGPELAAMPHPVVSVGPPLVRNSGVDLPLSPVVELARVRDAVRAAAALAFGPMHLYALPGQAGVFDPHVTLAYANADMPAAPVRAAVEAVPHRDLELTLESFTVLELRRQRRTWTWTGGLHLPFARRTAGVAAS
jgi:hypothetical protein